MAKVNVPSGMRSAPFDLKSNMSAYDQLPKKLRQALANANLNWSARQILRAYRSKQFTSDSLVELIRHNDEKRATTY